MDLHQFSNSRVSCFVQSFSKAVLLTSGELWSEQSLHARTYHIVNTIHVPSLSTNMALHLLQIVSLVAFICLPPINTRGSEHYPNAKAHVKPWSIQRAFLWVGLNCLTSLSPGVWDIMESGCHRMTESPGLEKTSKIIQSNHPPSTNISPLNYVP